MQTFTYDERDRLTSWSSNSPSESYHYDAIDNLTTKGSHTLTYPASGPNSVRPHGVLTDNGSGQFPYDANDNLYQDGYRTFTVNAENQPTSITYGGSGNENYSYAADGTRVTRAWAGANTAYIGGLIEADLGQGVIRRLYTLGGRVIAERTLTSTSNTVVYLHGDHLGSVSAITTASGSVQGTQRYTPWGEERNSSLPVTTLNFTGQRKDGTGLLFYNARSYDPARGRFMSPDSIVPGAANGSGGGAATLGSGSTTPLPVDFHEPGFASQLNQHNAATRSMGFWFELSSNERRKAESPMGPSNPQALNRYSYVLNNPLRYTDPTGHYQAIPTDGEGSEGGGWAPPDIVGGGGASGNGGGEAEGGEVAGGGESWSDTPTESAQEQEQAQQAAHEEVEPEEPEGNLRLRNDRWWKNQAQIDPHEAKSGLGKGSRFDLYLDEGNNVWAQTKDGRSRIWLGTLEHLQEVAPLSDFDP
ncbi:MAG: RHS repeat-associated core domain-containing protein [Herpetosiphonaceae bacterium]|nr:RHS repeat-associated core domain-containing protein [Herpetosiphonaceae bacterium]